MNWLIGHSFATGVMSHVWIATGTEQKSDEGRAKIREREKVDQVMGHYAVPLSYRFAR
jgi:hypothetical protein